MHRKKRQWWLVISTLAAVAALVVGCGTVSSPAGPVDAGGELPLTPGKPTLLFFFTDP